MSWKWKIILVIAGLLAVYWLITDPESFGHAVALFFRGIWIVLRAIVRFFVALAG